MSKYQSKEEIKEIIDFCCEKCGIPEFSSRIQFSFSNRFTSRMGDAIYLFSQGKGRIRLSAPLWPRMTEEKRRNTIIHEACHVIANYKFDNRQGHNRNWKRMMLLCGETPDRCYQSDEVDRSDLLRSNHGKKEECVCGCGPRTIGPIKYKRIVQGKAQYRCCECKELVLPLS